VPCFVLVDFYAVFLTMMVSGYDSRTLFVPKDAAKKFTPFEGQVLPSCSIQSGFSF
jgi:hypothetical protein